MDISRSTKPRGESIMTQSGKASSQQFGLWLAIVLMLLGSERARAAEIPATTMQLTRQAATPADTKVLTLDEAIQIALDNHPNIMAAKERIGAQQAVVGQQMAAYYPTVAWTNSYRTASQSSTTSASPPAFDAYTTQATLALTLYNFGRRESAVQSARYTLDATEYNYRTTIDDVIVGVKNSYFVYLGAKALVRVREETVKSRELLVRQAQGFYEVGTRARIDVVRAEADLYNAQADLIATRNAVDLAWQRLKFAMGLRELPERPLAETVTPVSLPFTLPEAKEIAYATRPELKSFEALRKAQDQNIANARRSHLPEFLFDTNVRGSGTSIDRLPSFLGLGWQVQLSVSIPIFDGFRTTNRVEETLRNYYVIRSQEEEQRQQVALDVEQSYLLVVELGERIKANEAAAKAAKENLDLATGRYQVGVGSIIEVTDAQTLYTDSETTYIRALYEQKIAEAQLQRAIGK